MIEEKKLILQMLKEGKINIEEAEKLLSEQEEKTNSNISQPTNTPSNKKFLRVLVKEGEKTNVNINIPIALAEVGLKFIPKKQLKIGDNEINIQEIVTLIKEGVEGELVNIDCIDKDEQVIVKIFIE